MAKLEQRKNGWLARIRRKGVDQSKTFDTKREAELWLRDLERKIDGFGKDSKEVETFHLKTTTLRETFERYIQEISPHKKGRNTVLHEQRRYNQMAVNPDHAPLPELMDKPISQIQSYHIAEWKMSRLKAVKETSVSRDKNFLCHVFSMALEWGYIQQSPFKGVKFKEDRSASRERRISEEEVAQVLFALDHWDKQIPPETPNQMIGLMWCLCIETAMRQQEVKLLKSHEVDLENRVIDLEAERTKEKKRKTLALTTEAVRLLKLGHTGKEYWFGSEKFNISNMFSKAVRKTTIDDLEFRDSRHEALTRLSEQLTPFELAKQAGHTDMNRTLKYYRKTARDFSSKLR